MNRDFGVVVGGNAEVVERPMRAKKSVCFESGAGRNWGDGCGFRMRAAGPRGAAGTRVVKGDLVVVVVGALGRAKVGIMGVFGVISKFRLG